MNKTTGFSLLIFLIVGLLLRLTGTTAWAGSYSGGAGSSENPYRITTAADLNDIGNNPNDWDKHFIMVNDINLADYTGEQFNKIGVNWWSDSFTGVFDGNNHVISNFTYIAPSAGSVGIFTAVGPGGEVKNLGVVDANVFALSNIAALVGYNLGTVSDCYTTGNVSSQSSGLEAGGLVGRNASQGTLTNCHSMADVHGNEYAGGLAGGNNGAIINCYATGNITTEGGNAQQYAGGLAGSSGGTIEQSYATGDVSAVIAVGGLVGTAGGIITDCHATGLAQASDHTAGGLVGWNDANIANSYATGGASANQDDAGGLVGDNQGQTISNCWAGATVSAGRYSAGGLVGENEAHSCITNSYSIAIVTGQSGVGGFVGVNRLGGIITNCYAKATVSGTGYSIGGLVGMNDGGTIDKCFAAGNVTGNDDVGGLVGSNKNQGILTDSYSLAAVSGQGTDAGGLTGQSYYAVVIENCYAAGPVDGNEVVGAFVGHHDPYNTSTYTGCFWDTTVNPDVNGIADANDPNIVGKTTYQMQTENTFTDAGWDLLEIWDIARNQAYPFLRVYSAGDVNYDGRVDLRDYAILAAHWLETTEP